jgi:fatty acid desaturase
MKRNMSDTDRIIRVVLAVLFAYLYFGGIVSGTWGIVLLVLAGVFVLTSILAFCPIYVPFKISTYKSK